MAKRKKKGARKKIGRVKLEPKTKTKTKTVRPKAKPKDVSGADEATEEIETRLMYLKAELTTLENKKRKSKEVKASIDAFKRQRSQLEHRLGVLRGTVTVTAKEANTPKGVTLKRGTTRAKVVRSVDLVAREEVNRWQDEARTREGRAGYTKWVRNEYERVIGSDAPKDKPLMLLSIRIRCELQAQGFKRVGAKLTKRAQQNYEASKTFNVSGFTETLRCNVVSRLQAMESVTLDEDTGVITMARVNNPDALRSYAGNGINGRTLQRALVEILSQDKVPADEVVIQAIVDEFDKPFTMLGWYKSMFRAGKLAGMDSVKGHVIKQAGGSYKKRGRKPGVKNKKKAGRKKLARKRPTNKRASRK